jgi:plastocyanin
MPDGNVLAFDAATGDELWRFQTGFGADGSVMTYEVDGEQYVAIATGGNRIPDSARGDAVWAFKLNGPLAPLNPPPAPLARNVFTSPPVTTDEAVIGAKWDATKKAAGNPSEYEFGPERLRAAVGTTVTWTNLGSTEHTATDQRGAWNTGLLAPGQSATVTFAESGSYIYTCQPHPWMLGEVVIQ